MRKKAVLSVIVTMMLMFSMAAVYIFSSPGPNPESLVVGPLPNITTTDDTPSPVSEEKAINNFDSYSGDAEDQGSTEGDDCEIPPEDECGNSDPCDPCNPCDPCDDECGCTYTIGYWKNHAGIGHGNQADLVTPLIASAGGSSGWETRTAQRAFR